MTNARQALGAHGERLAEANLVAQGMVVVDRNWRCPDGEVDLILRDGDAVVFCEVKTRRTATYGPPAAAVAGAKARRLRRLAARWLATTRVRPSDVRFDVVAIVLGPDDAAAVDHIRAAF